MHLIENWKSCFGVPGRPRLKTSELTLTCTTVVRILKIKFAQRAAASPQTRDTSGKCGEGRTILSNFSCLTYRLVSATLKERRRFVRNFGG